MDAVENFLAHYGVKGMRWGVRRSKSNQAGGAAAAQRTEDAQKTHEVIQRISKHGIGSASNSDLKMLEQRIKLEMKYNELFPKKKTIADHGLEIAKRVLIPVAEQQAKNFLNQQVSTKVLGAGTKPTTTKAPGATPQQVQSVLGLTGNHKMADQPKTKLPHFGFA